MRVLGAVFTLLCAFLQDFPLFKHYSQQQLDWFSRLKPDQTIEDRISYWRQRIHTSFNNSSGIITFEVEAFQPDSAAQIASLVLAYSHDLINQLSVQARRDALIHSEEEVVRAENRLTTALQSIRNFRESEMSLDPEGAARIHLELIGSLEKQLADLRTRIVTLQNSVGDDAPSLRNLIRQSQALTQQIAEQKSATAGIKGHSEPAALTGQLAIYETLEIERNFAQQYYASSLASLEKTRVEAGRQQRYLAVYSEPARPERPAYPRKFLNSVLCLGGLNLAWAIGALLTYAVRDHLA